MARKDLLSQPIDELGLSENFYLRCELMGFKNLSDILDTPSGEIIKMNGFTFGWMGELTKFLASKGMLHLLQPLPGNN